MSAPAPYVFVSYASADRVRVLPLVSVLERAGIGVWIDRAGIHGGANYGEEIAEAIRGAAALVLMTSAAALASRNVKQEIALAWDFERPYVPLLLEPVTIPTEVRYWLTVAQWIEVLDRTEGEWLPAVLTALAPLGIAPAAQTHEATQLAGRERELATMRERLAAAKEGNGGLVLIGGEAGIGKTTLAEAALRDAERQGFLTLVGRCYDLSETPPFGPWAEIREQCLRIPGLPPPPSIATSQTSSPAEFFAAVRDFFAAVASGTRPLVLLLDDLHWADPISLDLLRFLTRALGTMPILAIATYRSDEITRRHPLFPLLPLLVRESGATRLDLHPLDMDAIRALVVAQYDLPDEAVDRLATYLSARSEGNALFVAELLRALEETGTLQRDGERWRLGVLESLAVPPLLRQVIEFRIDRLDEETQRALAVAAVIGHEVPLAVWATVADMDEAALLDVAEGASAARLVMPTPDGLAIQFAHALIREALYEGVLPMRRRIHHRRTGEALAALPRPDPDAVAFHFQQAGDARAVAWLIRAGDRAERAYAWITAAARFEAALALMESDTASATERGWLLLRLATLNRVNDISHAIALLSELATILPASDDPLLAIYTLITGGMIRTFARDSDRGLPEMEMGVARLEALPAEQRARLNEVPASIRQAVDEDGVASLVLRQAAAGYFAAARELGERVIAATPGQTVGRTDDPPRGDAYLGLAGAYAALGLPEEARRAYGHAATEHRAVGHHLLVNASLATELRNVCIAYCTDDLTYRRRLLAAVDETYGKLVSAVTVPVTAYIVDALVINGRWQQVRDAAQAIRIGHWHGESGFWWGVALCAHLSGDEAEARSIVARMLPEGSATAPGNEPIFIAWRLQRLAGAMALAEDDLATAKEWLAAHDRWLAWSGAVLGQSEGQALWGQYHRQAGDMDTAYDHVQSALSHATEPRQPLALIAAHRLLGELDTEAGRYDSAQSHLDASLALADACAALYERALTLLALAELRAEEGDHNAARATLEEARAICTALGARPALTRADALAVRLTGN